MDIQIVNMEERELPKCRAIVRFGPETAIGGQRPAEYYQVIIDPSMASPSGRHIRFGFYDGDEIVGWQRVDAMTVCEVLEENPKCSPSTKDGYTDTEEKIVMRCVIKE